MIKISVIANIMKTQIFHQIKYYPWGHRSYKVILKFQNKFFLPHICLRPNLLTTFQERQHYEYANFDQMNYDLKGHPFHIKPLYCQKSF